MAEELIVDANATKADKYASLFPQIKALTESETDLTANLSNIAAALKYGMDFFWIGFYIVKQGQLVLGPFQGPVACTRIPFDKGVCGACYRERKTLIVPDVEQFPGHIACSSASRSEIVVPIFKDGEVVIVLDVDSTEPDDFDHIDQQYLEMLADWIGEMLF